MHGSLFFQMGTVLLTLACSVLLALSPPAAPPAIAAGEWINTLSVRPLDDRQFVVLFFDEKPSRELRKTVLELNKLARRGDVAVFAVTSGSRAVGRRFTEEYAPRFPVGVRSASFRSFQVKAFPAIVIINRDGQKPLTDPNTLDSLLGPAAPTADLPAEDLPIQELRERIQAANSPMDLEALAVLRIRSDSVSFLRFCDEIENSRGPANPWWLGQVRYERHLADPSVSQKQSGTSPAREVIQKARSSGRSTINEVTAVLKERDSWSTTELVDRFRSHLGNEEDDLMFRWNWASAIGLSGSTEYVDSLVEMLELEPDPAIRFWISSGIDEIHMNSPISDPTVLSRLEGRLETEDDIRWARPMLEMTIHNLKYGPE